MVGCFDGGENQHDVPSNLMAFLGAKSQSSRAPGCSWVLEGTLISQGLSVLRCPWLALGVFLGRCKCLWEEMELGDLAKARDYVKLIGDWASASSYTLPPPIFPLEGRGLL